MCGEAAADRSSTDLTPCGRGTVESGASIHFETAAVKAKI
jgi:hypothetical protein